MVEIIPKPTKKAPFWQDILLYISIVVVVLAIAAYFLLGYFIGENEKVLREKENILAQSITKEERDLEKAIFQQKQRIDDFASLINQQKISSNFFTFLEETTHPQVWFSKLSLNLPKAQAELSGEAEKTVLGQQLLIFKENEQILNVSLNDIQPKEGEIVSFAISLSFNPGILNP